MSDQVASISIYLSPNLRQRRLACQARRCNCSVPFAQCIRPVLHRRFDPFRLQASDGRGRQFLSTVGDAQRWQTLTWDALMLNVHQGRPRLGVGVKIQNQKCNCLPGPPVEGMRGSASEMMPNQKSRKSKSPSLKLCVFAAVIFGSGVACGHYLFPKTRLTIRHYPVAVPVPNDPPDMDSFTMYRT